MRLFTSSRRRACIRSSRCYLTPLTSWIFWCWCHCIPANQTHWSHGCDWCSALQDRETLVWCLMSEWDNWKYRRNPYHNKLLPRCDMTPASLYFVLLSTCWTQTLIIRWCCIYIRPPDAAQQRAGVCWTDTHLHCRTVKTLLELPVDPWVCTLRIWCQSAWPEVPSPCREIQMIRRCKPAQV